MGGVCSYLAVWYIPRRASGECCVTRFFAVSLCIQAGATAVSENTHKTFVQVNKMSVLKIDFLFLSSC